MSRRLALLLLVAGVGCADLAGLGEYGNLKSDAGGGPGSGGGPSTSSNGGGPNGGGGVGGSGGSGGGTMTPCTVGRSSAYRTLIADIAAGYWRLADMALAVGAAEVGNDGVYKGVINFGAQGLLVDDLDCAIFIPSTEQQLGNSLDVAQVNVDFTTSFSVEAWIDHDPSKEFGRIISKVTNNDEAGFSFYVDGATIHFEAFPSGAIASATFPGGPPPPRRHVVAVFDTEPEPEELRIYVDGSGVNTATISAAMTEGSGPFRVGRGFRGTIDEAAVYAYALTESEIGAHHDTGVALPTP